MTNPDDLVVSSSFFYTRMAVKAPVHLLDAPNKIDHITMGQLFHGTKSNVTGERTNNEINHWGKGVPPSMLKITPKTAIRWMN